MTLQDTKQLMAMIMAMYPAFQPKDPQETLKAWAWALEPYDFREIQKGFQAYIRSDTTGFAPAVGQLIGKAQEALSGELSDGEAWGMVVIALRNSTYGAEREFAKLPKVVQRAVGTPQVLTQWGQLEEHMLSGAEASFKRAYKTETGRSRAQASIGGTVQITGSGIPPKIAEKEPPKIETRDHGNVDYDEIEQRIAEIWE